MRLSSSPFSSNSNWLFFLILAVSMYFETIFAAGNDEMKLFLEKKRIQFENGMNIRLTVKPIFENQMYEIYLSQNDHSLVKRYKLSENQENEGRLGNNLIPKQEIEVLSHLGLLDSVKTIGETRFVKMYCFNAYPVHLMIEDGDINSLSKFFDFEVAINSTIKKLHERNIVLNRIDPKTILASSEGKHIDIYLADYTFASILPVPKNTEQAYLNTEAQMRDNKMIAKILYDLKNLIDKRYEPHAVPIDNRPIENKNQQENIEVPVTTHDTHSEEFDEKEFVKRQVFNIYTELQVINFNHQQFKLGKFLGKGEFAQTFAAEDPISNVVKIPSMPFVIEKLHRRQRNFCESKEVEVLRRLSLLINTSKDSDGRELIKMKFLTGSTIETLIDAEVVNSHDDFLDIATELSKSIRQLHSMNIAHNDIKLGNILLNVSRNSSGKLNVQVNLLDFGIAKTLDDMGKCHLTPEQAKERDWSQARRTLADAVFLFYYKTYLNNPITEQINSVLTF